MSLVGGGLTGSVGGVETASSAGGGSTPTPPVASTDSLFDVTLSFGHGMDVDANLPAATSFWLSPTAIADLARAGQVREWAVDQTLAFVGLSVVVSQSAGIGEGGLPLIVTQNGLDTLISIVIPNGIATDTVFEASVLLPVAAGAHLGARIDGSAVVDGAILQLQARLHGSASGTPTVPSTLPINAKALFVPEDLALDGNTWVDSVAGNLYTVTVPPDGPPPPGVDPISGPARRLDGSFNNHPYGYFRHYSGGDFGHPTYTPCMLATDTTMFGRSAAPIPARTFVAVVRAESSVGGIVASSQFTTPCFKGALSLPLGDLQQSPYFTQGTPDAGGQVAHVVPTVNLAAQEVVLVWRTDGSTLQFFIDGVQQTLDDSTIGSDNAAGEGFCIGNLASSKPIGKTGWQGAIAFVGVWARRFTDAEVLEATSYLSGLYVTP